jgi:hypothetical protein
VEPALPVQAHHLPMRAKPGEELRSSKAFAKKGERAGTERIERSDKVAAVDRRDEGSIVSGSSVCVSYQLYKWPRYFSSRSIVAKLRLVRADKLGHGQESKLARGLAGIEQRPTLVGETRRLQRGLLPQHCRG